MMKFKEYIQLREGGFINDEKATKSKRQPSAAEARGTSVTTCGIAGGPGGCDNAGGGAAPSGAASPLGKTMRKK